MLSLRSKGLQLNINPYSALLGLKIFNEVGGGKKKMSLDSKATV